MKVAIIKTTDINFIFPLSHRTKSISSANQFASCTSLYMIIIIEMDEMDEMNIKTVFLVENCIVRESQVRWPKCKSPLRSHYTIESTLKEDFIERGKRKNSTATKNHLPTFVTSFHT